MKVGYTDIMSMAYPTLVHALEWKSELENEKKKKMEEHAKASRKKSKIR